MKKFAVKDNEAFSSLFKLETRIRDLYDDFFILENMGEHKTKAYQELKTPALFNTVKPAGLSIEWLHGQDICPDDLYYNSIAAE